MTLNCVYITLCMHVCVYILCVCARSPPVICPSAPWAVYCDAVSLLFDGWQTITRRLILWLIICTISYRSTHTHTLTHTAAAYPDNLSGSAHTKTQWCVCLTSLHLHSSFAVFVSVGQQFFFPDLHLKAQLSLSTCPPLKVLQGTWTLKLILIPLYDLHEQRRPSARKLSISIDFPNGCLSFTCFKRKMHILVKWRTFWQETVVLIPTLSTEATTINKNGSSWQLL